MISAFAQAFPLQNLSVSAGQPKYNLLTLTLNVFGLDLSDLKTVDDVLHAVESNFPIHHLAQFPTLVAVSGGIDSMALLRSLAILVARNKDANPQNLIVAHVNHRTRLESDANEQFVCKVANQLGLKVLVGRADVKIPTSSPSQVHASEESLRDLRYDLLLKLAQESGARYLLTGHQKQDQVETILFRVFRGTGLSGLRGIPRKRLVNSSLTVVRPLLDLDRETLKAFLDDLSQPYRLDPSNDDSKYTRNFLRNDLMPMLETRFGPSVEEAVLRLSTQAVEAQELLTTLAERLLTQHVSMTKSSVSIDRSGLFDEPEIILQTMLSLIWKRQDWSQQKMDANWWRRLVNVITSESISTPRFDIPHGIACDVNDRMIVFRKL